MTVPIFIGTSANGEDGWAELVYAHSIQQNMIEDPRITFMKQTNDESSPWGGWVTKRWSTPFSGFRWAIPEVMGFEGRAIYTDVDMINYRNMRELLNIDMGGKPIAARRGNRFGGHEFCVMVIDCKAIQPYLIPLARMKKNPDTHHRYISFFSGSNLVQDLDPRWNCLDGEDRPMSDIWQLHFTKMATQPWKPSWFTGVTETHPRQDLVDDWFRRRDDLENMGILPPPPGERVVYDILGR